LLAYVYSQTACLGAQGSPVSSSACEKASSKFKKKGEMAAEVAQERQK
jgi:hypothetical protein